MSNAPIVPIYSGESGGTFTAWAQKFQDHIEGTALKLDEPSKLGRLKMFLDGMPRQALEEMPAGDRDTLAKALSSLKATLDSPVRAQLAKQSLALCRQKQGESIDKFVDRLVPLVFAAHPDQNPQAQKDMLRNAFLEKIQEEIAFYVRVGITPNQNFEEVRVKAIEVENLILTRKHKDSDEWISAINTVGNNQEPFHFPQGKFSTWQNRNPNEKKSVSFADSRSPSPPNYQTQHPNFYDSYSRNQNNRFSQTNNPQKTCNYCRKPGHLISECRTREYKYGPFPENKNNQNFSNFQPRNQNYNYNNHNNYNPSFQHQERMNPMDNSDMNHFNNMAMDPNHYDLKSISFSSRPHTQSQPAKSTNLVENMRIPKPIQSPSSKPTDPSPKPNPVPPISLENWESTGFSKSYSIAPFLSRFATILFLFTLLIPCSLSVHLNQANASHIPTHPMICQTEQQGTYWTIPNFPPCPRLTANAHDTPKLQNLRLFRPNAFKQFTKAWACRIIVKGEVEYTNPINDLIKKEFLPQNLLLSPNECLLMIQAKVCAHGTLKLESGLWHTDNRISYDKRYPIAGWAWQTHTSHNCYLFESEITVPHGSEILHSPLGQMNHCNYTSGNCSLADNTTLIWTPNPEKQCLYLPIGEFSGHIMANVWLEDSQEIGLSFDSNYSIIHDCNKTLNATQQGFAVEFINPKLKSKRRNKRSFEHFKWSSESLTTNSETASQLTFLDHEVKDSLTFQFTHSLHQLCEFAEETRRWTTTALLSDPTNLARSILTNPYIIAKRISANALKIWPCVPLSENQYNLTATKLETCFDLLPISLKSQGDEKLAFINPSTLIISPKSKMAPCSQFRLIPISLNNSLIEVDQISGNTTIIHTQSLSNPLLTPFDPIQIKTHAFHHLALVNLTDIISHAYITNLAEVSRITYHIEQQNSAVATTMSADWKAFKDEITKEVVGDWTQVRNWFCLIVCIIASLDIGLRIAVIVLEKYLGNNLIIQSLTAFRHSPSQSPSHQLLSPSTPTSNLSPQNIISTPILNNNPIVCYNNARPSQPQIILSLGEPVLGQPARWPPSVSRFPIIPSNTPTTTRRLSSISLGNTSHEFVNVFTHNPNNVPHSIINVFIDEIFMKKALIDTGATVSVGRHLLGKNVAARYNDSSLPIIPISGWEIRAIGSIRVKITICGCTRHVTIYLLPDHLSIWDKCDLIIGHDVLTQIPPIIFDFQNRSISVNGNSTYRVPMLTDKVNNSNFRRRGNMCRSDDNQERSNTHMRQGLSFGHSRRSGQSNITEIAQSPPVTHQTPPAPNPNFNHPTPIIYYPLPPQPQQFQIFLPPIPTQLLAPVQVPIPNMPFQTPAHSFEPAFPPAFPPNSPTTCEWIRKEQEKQEEEFRARLPFQLAKYQPKSDQVNFGISDANPDIPGTSLSYTPLPTNKQTLPSDITERSMPHEQHHNSNSDSDLLSQPIFEPQITTSQRID